MNTRSKLKVINDVNYDNYRELGNYRCVQANSVQNEFLSERWKSARSSRSAFSPNHWFIDFFVIFWIFERSMCKNSMSQAKSTSQPLAYQPDQVIGYGNYSEQCELEEGEIVDDGDGFWTDVVVEQARIRISKNLFGSNSLLFNKLQRRLIFKIGKD